MRPWTESRARGSAFRRLWVVAAVLAVLIAGITAAEKGASATSYDSTELEVLRLINQYREDNGLGALLLSDTLSISSERHSEDMARYRFFAHDTVASSYYPAGSEPWDRMRAEGYDYNTSMGENIAVGYETAEQAFEAWRNSPSHNAAMLDGRYRVIGIAALDVPGSVHGLYWTTDFGATVDPTSHAPGERPRTEETSEEPDEDKAGIENGEMNGEGVWEQEATDRAELILDGYARLGDNGGEEDDLRQKIRVGENAQLAYEVKVTTAERRRPFDRLVVRLTDGEGRQIAVLEKYAGSGDAGGWRRDRVDLSRFAGRTVYVSFHAETDPTRLTTFYLDNVVLKKSQDRS